MTPSRLALEKTTFAIAGVMAIGTDSKSTCARERLYVDGVEITPKASLDIVSLSPNGFAWGYSGRGADQTALAICLYIFRNADIAKAIYPAFKATFVQQWPLAQTFNLEIDIANFLLDYWSTISKACYLNQKNDHPYET